MLIGQVINTNAAWMAEELNLAGFDVRQITAISDKGTEIQRALQEASERADVILMTGGLGPTKDDITKQILCEFFSTELVINDRVLENVRSFFEKKGLPLTQLNHDQALVPKSALVLDNPVGTAPGLAFEQDGRLYVSMPGVPYEMKYIMETFVIPRLVSKSKGDVIVHKTILTQGIGESFLAEIIKDWENDLHPDIKLAYLPSPGIVRLRLSMRGKDKQAMETLLAEKISALKLLIPKYIWGEGKETLEEVIGRLLKQKGQSIVTAESCTGGFVAHRITSIPGSSGYFKGSIIAYDNQVKQNLLGVEARILDDYGAVSSQTVKQMALGAKKLLNADYAVSVSGIAGPDGGTADKPVGTVWIGLAKPDGSVVSRKFLFGDQRQRNILRATNAALGMVFKYLS